MLVEVCVSSIEDVITLNNTNVSRIELCSTMEVIGITPSLGYYLEAKKLTNLPMVIMIRPRAGFYNYSDSEFEVMKSDLKIFYEHGARDFVFGICDDQGEIDIHRCKTLMDAVPDDCNFTYHKAFDHVQDFDHSINQLIDLGFSRVLTAGGPKAIEENYVVLKELIENYSDKIEIILGGGLTYDNIADIHQILKHNVYHLSAKSYKGETMKHIQTDQELLMKFMDRLQTSDMDINKENPDNRSVSYEDKTT